MRIRVRKDTAWVKRTQDGDLTKTPFSAIFRCSDSVTNVRQSRAKFRTYTIQTKDLQPAVFSREGEGKRDDTQ